MTTQTVTGKRLQPTCRALGLTYTEAGRWVKRGGYSNFKVSGVNLSEQDAATLTAHLTDKADKAAARRERANDPAFAAKKADSKAKREAKELAAIALVVNSRWTLPARLVTEFCEHANTPGEGRVVRAKSCAQDFETRVYMALVAWVRHNETNYEQDLRDAKSEAFEGYRAMLPDRDAGESWDDCDSSRDERDQALEDARQAFESAYVACKNKTTQQAVAWLRVRETN